MNPLESVKQWLLRVALVKGVKRVIQLLVTWLTALGLSQYGVEINPEKLTVVLFGLSESFRNYLKHRWPDALGWL